MYDLEKYKYRLAILAFYLRADEFINEVELFGLPSDLFENVPQSEDYKFPIQLIIRCWEIALDNEKSWTKEVQPIIKRRIANRNRLKQYLCSKHGMPMPTIDFYSSPIPFFRDMPEDSYDDVFGCDKAAVLKAHKEIDAELFVAVNKFDFEAVERLLESGANPKERFQEVDDYNCFDRIGAECSYLAMELDVVEHHANLPLYITNTNLLDLFGFAAHESMYQLLEKYSNRIQ